MGSVQILSAAVVCLMVLGGCAKRADKITASYVSPLIYDNYNCDQLAAEGARLSTNAAKLAGVQDKQATNDAVAMGVGLVLFWPSLFFIKGGKQTESELAQLRGQMNTLEQVSIAKQCGIQFQKTDVS
jgi:hypothetical protein